MSTRIHTVYECIGLGVRGTGVWGIGVFGAQGYMLGKYEGTLYEFIRILVDRDSRYNAYRDSEIRKKGIGNQIFKY